MAISEPAINPTCVFSVLFSSLARKKSSGCGRKVSNSNQTSLQPRKKFSGFENSSRNTQPVEATKAHRFELLWSKRVCEILPVNRNVKRFVLEKKKTHVRWWNCLWFCWKFCCNQNEEIGLHSKICYNLHSRKRSIFIRRLQMRMFRKLIFKVSDI
jgi:hypothetical protein